MLGKKLLDLVMSMAGEEAVPAVVGVKQGCRGAAGLFCSKPFTWFEISRGAEEGEVFLCCPSWLEKPVGNLTRQSVEEVWNGEAAQAIRKSILDGSFRYCNTKCPHLQRIDEPVQRVADVRDEEMLRIIRERLTVLPFGPREVNCSFDRSCNLSCPSCRTQLIMETDQAGRILGIQKRLEREALADARLLYITGSGDPFGSPFFRRWLQTMKRSDMPKLERIHLHSNGLLWMPRIWASIPDEMRVLIRWADISIDAATAGTYATNRRGGDFNTLLKRLEFIARLRSEGPLEWLGINMTVQANNYKEIPAFVELGQRYNCDTVIFHQLSNWGTFSEGEFATRAVHFQGHPEHADFLDILTRSELDDPIVYVSNLTEHRRQALAARKTAA